MNCCSLSSVVAMAGAWRRVEDGIHSDLPFCVSYVVVTVAYACRTIQARDRVIYLEHNTDPLCVAWPLYMQF